MPGVLQTARYRQIAALVRQEPHIGCQLQTSAQQNSFFVSQRIGGIVHGRLDINSGEVRVGINQLLLRRALSQLPKDQLHRNSCPSDHWFSQHDLRIYFNTVGNSHGFLSSIWSENQQFTVRASQTRGTRQARISERIRRRFVSSDWGVPTADRPCRAFVLRIAPPGPFPD